MYLVHAMSYKVRPYFFDENELFVKPLFAIPLEDDLFSAFHNSCVDYAENTISKKSDLVKEDSYIIASVNCFPYKENRCAFPRARHGAP
ncbi:hypothetical protein LSPH24S_04189 [Lysinibacillus sphaericus]